MPHQYEFARLNLTYTVMSKRKLIQLVNEKLVNGWDDPRMLTISGLAPPRRNGERVARVRLQHRHHQISEHDRRGRARSHHSRGVQSHRCAPARRAATRSRWCSRIIPKEKPKNSTRSIIRKMRVPEHARCRSGASSSSSATISWKRRRRNIFGLRPGGEVRLKYAYIIKCDEVVKDASAT